MRCAASFSAVMSLNVCFSSLIAANEQLESVFQESMKELQVFKPQSTCQYDAIKGLLPRCDVTVVNAETRTLYAVELSKCEFKHSGIKYPVECDNIDNSLHVSVCTVQLESKPQWWTSYSGNYRLVGQICAQHQNEHYRAHLVQLHQNITELQRNFAAHLYSSLDALDLTRIYDNATGDMVHFKQQFDKLDQNLSQLTVKVSAGLDLVHKQSSQIDLQIADIYNKSAVYSNHINNLLTQMTERLYSAVERLDRVAKSIDHVNETACSLVSQHHIMKSSLRESSALAARLSSLLKTARNNAKKQAQYQTTILTGIGTCVKGTVRLCGLVAIVAIIKAVLRWSSD